MSTGRTSDSGYADQSPTVPWTARCGWDPPRTSWYAGRAAGVSSSTAISPARLASRARAVPAGSVLSSATLCWTTVRSDAAGGEENHTPPNIQSHGRGGEAGEQPRPRPPEQGETAEHGHRRPQPRQERLQQAPQPPDPVGHGGVQGEQTGDPEGTADEPGVPRPQPARADHATPYASSAASRAAAPATRGLSAGASSSGWVVRTDITIGGPSGGQVMPTSLLPP